ncbi:MAG: chemotaxis protein CheW [Thermodesulfobacteriota bacterium]
MPSSGWTIEKQRHQENLEVKPERQILVFTLDRKEFGVDLSCVREVLRLEEIHSLPKTPSFIAGVIHLRGRLIPLIDLGKKLHGERVGAEPCKRIIVCRISRFIVGLTVESLKEIIALSRGEINPIPEVVSLHADTEVLSGIGKIADRVIPILNLERVLNGREVTELSTLGS